MITEEQVASLKAKHGEHLVHIEASSGDLVFRRPTRHEYDRWFDKMQADKGNASAHARELAQATVVFPDQAGLMTALDTSPGILTTTLVDAITDLAGLGGVTQVKKL